MPILPKCLSRIQFGSFLAYSPRGQSEESKKSRRITYAIKNVQAGYIDAIVARLREEMKPGKPAAILHQVLGDDVLVVPCPRSSPLVKGALWPSREICDALVHHGLAQGSSAMLERFLAVPKSSVAGVGQRPRPPAHIRSMRLIAQPTLAPLRITIVDDVITRGATLIAAATLLQRQFVNCEVHSFSLVRTKSFDPEVGPILDPVIGEVAFKGTDASRNP